MRPAWNGVSAIVSNARFVRSVVASPRTRQRLPRICAIFQLLLPCVIRTMRAAVDVPIRFHAVPDDAALAVLTHRRERMDRAFEAVEHVRLGPHEDGERLVVLVAADFTRRHGALLQ